VPALLAPGSAHQHDGRRQHGHRDDSPQGVADWPQRQRCRRCAVSPAERTQRDDGHHRVQRQESLFTEETHKGPAQRVRQQKVGPDKGAGRYGYRDCITHFVSLICTLHEGM
jgi:hypothetical protein